jgi:DNA-binding transcriptional ArsR family regulator
MEFLVRLFKSLGNENRLRIVEFLLQNEEIALETLASELKLPYKTVARNLKILERAGLVTSRIWQGLALYSLHTSPDFKYNRAIFDLVKMRFREKKGS